MITKRDEILSAIKAYIAAHAHTHTQSDSFVILVYDWSAILCNRSFSVAECVISLLTYVHNY